MTNIGAILDKCVGCGLCDFLCPFGAIQMGEGSEPGHFLKPKVLEDKCRNCGLCLKKCPACFEGGTEKPPLATALFINGDPECFPKSSSGAFFPALAEETLRQGGTVYGAAWADDLKVCHIRVSDYEGLRRLKRSKYVQSKISNEIFKSLIDDAASGKMVLFSGTPCQCYAVFSLFDHQPPENVFLMDVICHGTPSQWMFDTWRLEEEKRRNISITAFDFRVKKQNAGVRNFEYRYQYLSSKTPRLRRGSPCFNNYLLAFYSDKFYGASCYHCPFRGPRLFTDFTAGDFWNIGNIDPTIKNDESKSMVFLNSAKALLLFSLLSSKGHHVKEFPFDSCANLNQAFSYNPTVPRFQFDSDYLDFIRRKRTFYKIFAHIKGLIKRLLKKRVNIFCEDKEVDSRNSSHNTSVDL